MNLPQPIYVGFGMLTPVAIMVVEQLPIHNTGALVKEVSEFVFDDAAIIACLLRQWDLPTAMIGTMLGDDPRGHLLARQLEEWGVQGEVRFSKVIKTPGRWTSRTRRERGRISGRGHHRCWIPSTRPTFPSWRGRACCTSTGMTAITSCVPWTKPYA